VQHAMQGMPQRTLISASTSQDCPLGSNDQGMLTCEDCCPAPHVVRDNKTSSIGFKNQPTFNSKVAPRQHKIASSLLLEKAHACMCMSTHAGCSQLLQPLDETAAARAATQQLISECTCLVKAAVSEYCCLNSGWVCSCTLPLPSC
jgi:hypothetical protein